MSIPVSENVQHFLNKIYDDRYAIKRAVYEVLIVFTVQNKSLSEVQVYIRANYHWTYIQLTIKDIQHQVFVDKNK